MKFVKANLVLVICAAVALLVIVSVFYPWGSFTSELQKDATERYTGTQADIKKMMGTSLVVPGVPEGHGLPSPNYISVKKEVNESMKTQAAEIVKNGADANRGNRVKIVNGTTVPLLEGKEQAHFLPKTARERGADPNSFKFDYEAAIKGWQVKLVGSETPGVPPSQQELTEELAAQKAKLIASRGPNATMQPLPGGDAAEQLNFNRRSVMNRAKAIKMYVDGPAFQIRAFLNTENPPNEVEIFQALTDTWLQGDVVRAIDATNGVAKEKTVGASPVKRLMRIAVGGDAMVSKIGTFGTAAAAAAAGGQMNGTPATGGLYLLPAAVPGAAPSDAPVEGNVEVPVTSAVNPPNTIDVMRSLTGRASGSDYDVVMMAINIDIDPAYRNRFIEQLYKQNMGYTVVNVRSLTVDPLERVSNGYIYGETQVEEVEILVECLVFRSWTLPIMPVPIRAVLGIPADAPAAAPQ